MKKDVKQENILIAKFMGVGIVERNGHPAVYMFDGDMFPEYFYATCYNRYDEDWNYLMPVIETISAIKFEEEDITSYPRTFGMPNADGKPMFRFNRFSLFTEDTLIEAAYCAVVEFIKWYGTWIDVNETS